MPVHKVFTKAFWNRSRIIWGLIVGLCTSIPIVCGSVYMMVSWTEAKVVNPYLTNKFTYICEEKQKPLKQDIKTIITDIKFMRGCAELSTPKKIQEKVISQMIKDSIAESKYVTK